jgi:hypothetical protein
MKAKLSFALVVLAFSLGLIPAPASSVVVPTKCSAFCATVRCIEGTICGPYINSAGQKACGCHVP